MIQLHHRTKYNESDVVVFLIEGALLSRRNAIPRSVVTTEPPNTVYLIITKLFQSLKVEQ